MSSAHKEVFSLWIIFSNESLSWAFKTSALSIIYASLHIWNDILFLRISAGPYSMCSTTLDMWHGIVRWLFEDMGNGASESREHSQRLFYS